MSKKRPSRLEVVSEHATGIREASGVAPVGDGSFLVVDDEEGVFRVVPGREPEPVAAGRGFADLEGICVANDGSRAWVLAERDGAVWSFDMQGGAPTNAARLGTLPSMNENTNAGWEGLAFAPAGTWADGPRLVAAHQRKPRCIAVVDVDSLACERTYRLPKAARKTLDDLNDVAVHPKTGELAVLSGKAGRLARLVRSGDELALVSIHAVEASRDDVPEGLAYDAAAKLWIVWDGSGRLREVRLS